MRTANFVAAIVSLVSGGVATSVYAQTPTMPIVINDDVGSKRFGTAVNVNMSGLGAGVNGPQKAQFGTNMGCIKDNWLTASVSEGDIDCLNVKVFQGGPNSDARGIVTSTQNTGQGFSNGAEMVMSSVRLSDNVVPLFGDVQLADVTSDGQMTGMAFNSVQGAATAGISIDTKGSASWTDLLRAVKNGKVYFTITGAGSILTSGYVNAAGLVTSGAVKAASLPVTELPTSQTVEKANCGTTLRSRSDAPITLVVPNGLPIGCHIDVIQATSGAITIEGHNMEEEHLGTPDRWTGQTQGLSAQAELLIDSPKSFLLRGDVKALQPEALAFVSYDRPFADK